MNGRSVPAPEVRADEIDEQFVPRHRVEACSVELDRELVVAAPAGGARFEAHWLDRTASIVWAAFDGHSPLAELIDDLSDAFGADRETVHRDVIQLAQTLGRAGLLEGVAYDPPPPPNLLRPAGLPPGTEVPPFGGRDLDGRAVASADLLGQRWCVVNWSPTCGFCTNLTGELATLVPRLRAIGIELVLYASGGADANRDLLEEAQVDCRVVLSDEGDAEVFRGLGTPCAYLVDSRGSVESELAYGADEVPQLLRGLFPRDEP